MGGGGAKGEERTGREHYVEGVNQDGTTEATRDGQLSWAAHGNPDPILFPPGNRIMILAFMQSGGEGADARVGDGPRVSRAYIRVGPPFPPHLQR